MNDKDTLTTINNLFNENKIKDLKGFIKQRSCLNTGNQYLTYLFYLFQTCGVFSVSIGQAYSNPYLSWTGVGLNSLASFIYIIINSNSKINNQLLNNIQLIKDNKYIDECVIDGLQEKKEVKVNTDVEV